MSEHEFEAYLNLLSRALGLSAKQRAQIAGELRDHMEARLNELMEGGMSRDDAVLAAIDDFGDASILAQELGALVKRRKRKKLVRVGLASAAAFAFAFVAVIGLTPPDGHAEERLSPTVVQLDAPASDRVMTFEARLLAVDSDRLETLGWLDGKSVRGLELVEGVVKSDAWLASAVASEGVDSLSAPRITSLLNQRATLMLASQEAVVLPGNQAEQAAWRGLRIGVIGAESLEDGRIRLAVDIANQWLSDALDVPATMPHPAVPSVTPACVQMGFVCELPLGVPVVCRLPMEAALFGGALPNADQDAVLLLVMRVGVTNNTQRACIEPESETEAG